MADTCIHGPVLHDHAAQLSQIDSSGGETKIFTAAVTNAGPVRAASDYQKELPCL